MANSFEPLFAGSGVPTREGNLPGWLAAIGQARGFSAHPYLSSSAPQPVSSGAPTAEQAAYDEGERAGREAAMADLAKLDTARDKLGLALARLDTELEEHLSARLSETVAALCEATLAPLAIDQEALQARCIAAAGAVGEGIIDASLRLHPDDIALLDPQFAATWHLIPDLALERGTVVFDMPEGAVRDGPEEWRGALREALGLKCLGQC